MRRLLTGTALALCLGGALIMTMATPSLAQIKDGRITIALSGGLDRLDPALTSNGTDMMILNQIFDTLLTMGPDGKLLPGVAKSYEAIGDNVWRFHLRDDVKFHDGSQLTAADVKFSIERILDENSPRRMRRSSARSRSSTFSTTTPSTW